MSCRIRKIVPFPRFRLIPPVQTIRLERRSAVRRLVVNCTAQDDVCHAGGCGSFFNASSGPSFPARSEHNRFSLSFLENRPPAGLPPSSSPFLPPSFMLSIRRIDSRREDIRAAMNALRRDRARRQCRQRSRAAANDRGFWRTALARRGRPTHLPRRENRRPAGPAGRFGPHRPGPLTAETIRVSPQELAEAHARADAGFFAAIRSIRQRIWNFQEAILTRTSASKCPAATWSSAIARWIASACACRAARPPIRRPC